MRYPLDGEAMDLLDVPLPELTLAIDIDPSSFLDPCEAIAGERGWLIDRRPAYAGPGYDQLNLHIGDGPQRYPMLRLVSVPRERRRLQLDVVTRWNTWPIAYDEYFNVARQAYKELLTAYNAAHSRRYRLGVPKRPQSVNLRDIDCGRISYAAEKFDGLRRSLAIGEGDARARLISAFMSFYVIRPGDLPPPLRKHLAWVYAQITKRPARHHLEGTVEATVHTMKNATAAKILQRLVDLADAINVLDRHCRGQRGLAV
jgi:hypothetical protein